jgi:hypothetical protein
MSANVLLFSGTEEPQMSQRYARLWAAPVSSGQQNTVAGPLMLFDDKCDGVLCMSIEDIRVLI